MDTQIYEKIQNQLKQQPGTSAAEICRRMDVNINHFYAHKMKLKGKKKTGVKKQMAQQVFTVPTVQSRARVVVVQCWADELETVLKGLQ